MVEGSWHQSDQDRRSDCDRNHWFNAQEALDYGIVDKIVYPDDRDEEPIYPAGNI